MTLGQGIEVGPFHFPIIRMLIAVGVARVLIRGERLGNEMNSLDRLMLVWATWALFSSVFHNDPRQELIYKLGLTYNACGIYFLLRIFCQSIDDVKVLCQITAILLIPLGVELLYEKMAVRNLFSIFGGVREIPYIRDGNVRAGGPFAHPILAGTVGAVCLPLMIGIWQQYRTIAFVGILSCLAIIIASTSSGPIMSTIAAIVGLLMWRYRNNMRLVRWFLILGYIALEIVMIAPAYYILARIDLFSGSTGWHRAALIESAIKHLNEWWLGGTDYTRHWMPTGVSWSVDNTDITNHYIQMGVIGGLPLMLLFIIILSKGFTFVGQTLRQATNLTKESQFMVWTFGVSLFVHVATFISVSYFDQSYVFIYLTLAIISSTSMARHPSII